MEEDALLCVVHEQGLLGLHLLDAEQDKKLAVAGQLDLKMVKGSRTGPREFSLKGLKIRLSNFPDKGEIKYQLRPIRD